MKKLLLTTILLSVFGFASAQTNEKAAIDTIEVKNPHLFSKHEVYVDHSKNYNLYAAKYLHRSGYFRAAALVCTASAGVAWYVVERISQVMSRLLRSVDLL